MTGSFWNKFLQNISYHRAALFFGLVGALIVAAPFFVSVFSLGQEYKGMPFLYQDSELRYLSRIHEVYDGHVALGSPMVYEYKETPTPFAPMGEYLYVFLSKIFFLSLNSTIILGKFLFPLILFLLVYFWVYVLAKDIEIETPRLTAVTASSVVLLGYDFVDAGFVLDIFRNWESLFYLSLWTRLVNPITGAVLLFGFLLSLRNVIRAKPYAWLYAGAILGLMTGYIFSFSLALATVIVLIFLLILLRRYSLAKTTAGVIIIGGGINIFQFSDFIRSLFLPSGQELALRGGLFLTHEPILSKVLLVSAVVWFVAIVFPKLLKKDKSMDWQIKDSELIFCSLLISAFLVMNQQVVTGRTVWPQHFVQYTIPISIIALVVSCAYVLSSRFIFIWRFISVGIILMGFVFGLKSVDSYTARMDDFTDRQRYQESLNWFEANTQKDCVVFSVEKEYLLSDMIPAFTHCNTYHTSFTFIALPKERIIHNYFMWLRFNGLTVANSDNYFATNTGEYRRLLFDDWKELFTDMDDRWLTKISDREVIDLKYKKMSETLSEQYKNSLQGDFYKDLKKYRLDYVIWDSKRYPEWDSSKFPFLNEVYASFGVHIYKVK